MQHAYLEFFQTDISSNLALAENQASMTIQTAGTVTPCMGTLKIAMLFARTMHYYTLANGDLHGHTTINSALTHKVQVQKVNVQ